MELTYTDSSWADVGLLDYSSADFAWGSDENDFEVVLAPSSGVPEVGSLVYDASGELGGIVRGYESSYDSDGLKIVGDTWTGIINTRILCPDSGQAYLTVSGDLSACISTLVEKLGLEWLFSVDTAKVGVAVSHTFTGSRDLYQDDAGRYMGGWSALWQMLVDSGCKCRMRWNPGSRRVVLSGMRRRDWTDSESIDAGVSAVSVNSRKPVNHLVCLGQGELSQRTVVHLYADGSGKVSETQSIEGADEISEVYSDASAEDRATLVSDGKKKLASGFELGDLVGGTDVKTGVSATAIVTKVTVTVSGDGAVETTYESNVRR